MSIAIAITPHHEVAGHFGKAAGFVVYDEQGQLIAELVNSGRREVGCKHKKQLQAQLAEHQVKTLLLGNVGQRSLARLLRAGFDVFRVPNRSSVQDVLNGKVTREPLLSAEQGRPCKREKGGCGCGCGSKKTEKPAKIGMTAGGNSNLQGLTKIGGFKL
ncbi:NifB/NifX family molybdenum-iron cluster-binding protein [Photobacterium lutimaris]|uniref:Dinitrogenase iron-molybdenum cofactor biosynthesis domain-containing protein n=1 Tax=Photobacterium lutimaris TaxID=388278 RepID=A0A2T3IVZ2_9GAMM|nr:NifB/NifX family molybdenum-iron cluster-binding protein [Photobacterium lutimaris]PSU32632.1 hypothetical protein C9I99_16305 [Photobacterium lutimaris]TDR74235.1 putative Fe-Mo cluster-binding NifX family protein [Photobacterium lutimaris]